MLREITATQFDEWREMFRIWNLDESDPEFRDDLRMGIATATAVNIAKGGKGTAEKPQKFFPVFSTPDAETDPLANAKSFVEGMSKIAVRKDKPDKKAKAPPNVDDRKTQRPTHS